MPIDKKIEKFIMTIELYEHPDNPGHGKSFMIHFYDRETKQIQMTSYDVKPEEMFTRINKALKD